MIANVPSKIVEKLMVSIYGLIGRKYDALYL